MVGNLVEMTWRDKASRYEVIVRELWGIDDPKVIESIRTEAARRSRGVIRGVLLLLAIGLCGGVVIGISEMFVSVPSWMAGGLVGGVAVYVISKVRGGRLDSELPGVLRELGRCVQCGYKLDEADSQTCPECGGAAS